MTIPRPGDLVRHKETGLYPSLDGHYGLVQSEDSGMLGVEWDTDTPSEHGCIGHDLFLLPPSRANSGCYVVSDDVEVL